MFKNLSNIASIMKQAQEIGSNMNQMSETLRSKRIVGSSGGGMIEIEVNGLMEALACRIDPQLLAQNDKTMLEDLIVAAVNQAVVKSKQTHAEAISEMTGGLSLPGLNEALSKLTGGTTE